MPGENQDYGSSENHSQSTMAIVLGSVSIVGGVVASVFPITLPLGVTLIIVGSVAVTGGSGYKIADKVVSKKREKKEKKQKISNIHHRLSSRPDENEEELNQIFNSPKVVDFKSNRSGVRSFNHAEPKKEINTEKREKRNGKRK